MDKAYVITIVIVIAVRIPYRQFFFCGRNSNTQGERTSTETFFYMSGQRKN
jgi:hypothetical protein